MVDVGDCVGVEVGNIVGVIDGIGVWIGVGVGHADSLEKFFVIVVSISQFPEPLGQEAKVFSEVKVPE
jgi:hypothetical protein